MKNNTRLREFVRVDAMGRVILGTNIARKHRPRHWRVREKTNELGGRTATSTTTSTNIL